MRSPLIAPLPGEETNAPPVEMTRRSALARSRQRRNARPGRDPKPFKHRQPLAAAKSASPVAATSAASALAARPVRAPQPSAALPIAPAPSPSRTGRHFHFHLDSDRREVTMRLRFTIAVVACFGIVLSVALAYVLGRRAGMHPTVLAAETQPDAGIAEVKPSALDVPRRTFHPPTGGAAPSSSPRVKPPVRVRDSEHGSTPNVPNTVDGLPPIPLSRRRRG